MDTSSQTVATLHDLLSYDASKFLSAEIQLSLILPEWILSTNSIKLKSVLQKYFELVQQHVQKLEPFFEEEKIKSLSMNNKIMEAFINEVEERLFRCTDSMVKDACLLASIQTINHYKISIYGTAASFANALNKEEHASIFHEAEVNEKQIDDRLSQLAEFEINAKAIIPVLIS